MARRHPEGENNRLAVYAAHTEPVYESCRASGIRFHAHPGFTRFMAAHPLISRFIAEHPKTSRLSWRVAHHIPMLDHYVPIAPHIKQVFRPPRRATATQEIQVLEKKWCAGVTGAPLSGLPPRRGVPGFQRPLAVQLRLNGLERGQRHRAHAFGPQQIVSDAQNFDCSASSPRSSISLVGMRVWDMVFSFVCGPRPSRP